MRTAVQNADKIHSFEDGDDHTVAYLNYIHMFKEGHSRLNDALFSRQNTRFINGNMSKACNDEYAIRML